MKGEFRTHRHLALYVFAAIPTEQSGYGVSASEQINGFGEEVL